VNPKEFLDIPPGHVLVGIWADGKSVITRWRRRRGCDEIITYEGEIEKRIARAAQRLQVSFQEAVNMALDYGIADLKRRSRRR